jgi:hypothetical protein
MRFFHPLVTFSLLGRNIFLSTSFGETVFFFPCVKTDDVSHPYVSFHILTAFYGLSRISEFSVCEIITYSLRLAV